MALKLCRECGKEVSTEALTCPHCGLPKPTQAGVVSAEVPGPKASRKKAEYVALATCIAIIAAFVFWPKSESNCLTSPPVTSTPSGNIESAEDESPQPLPVSISDFVQSSTVNVPLTMPTEQSGSYQAACTALLTGLDISNQKLYNTCVSQDQTAYSDLVRVSRNYSGMPDAQQNLDALINQWTKNGSRNDSLILMMFNHEIEDFRDFRWLSSSQNFNEDDARRCIQEWSSTRVAFRNWTLLDYCYRQTPDFKLPPSNQ